MIASFIWMFRWGFGLLLLLLMVGNLFFCTTEPVKADRYEVRGVFLGPRFEGAAMRVRHEAIPGFMDAMAMDFKLADPAEIETLKPGDKVTFVYVVLEDDSYAERIELLPPETPLELEGSH